MKVTLYIWLGLLACTARGQTLVRTGYDDPSILRIAPGQVVTLYAAGLKTILPGGIIRAGSTPVPSSLAGISVTLKQSSAVKSLPILAVEQFSRCTGAVSSDCLVSALTVQIPFDIAVAGPASIAPAGFTTLTISENGSASRDFSVYPVPDQVHVLTSCDVNGSTRGTGICFPMVAHADGSLVLQALRAGDQAPLTASEAKPGEVLTMYLYGLGVVTPAVNAGDVTPVPAPTTNSPVTLRYDYGINAAPSMPPGLAPGYFPFSAVFSGLAPGQVGVYQVNFVVPMPPAGIVPCGPAVNSNLTVSVSLSGGTFDGAAICVDPQ